MRIVCPACAAVYEIPPDRLPAGRRTRCARCGEAWAPTPAFAESAFIPQPAPDPASSPPTESLSAADRQAAGSLEEERPRLVRVAPAPQPGSGSSVWVGWLASALILAAVGWGGYAYRSQVMSAWPPSARLYSALGLTG